MKTYIGEQEEHKMYKIDAEQAHNMIAVIQEQANIPEDAIQLLQKNVNKQITTGETQDFYQGFLSALSLVLEIYAKSSDRADFIPVLAQLMKKTAQFYVAQSNE